MFLSHLQMNFDKILIKWYHQNKRDLPWRNTRDPYFIWVSEIILQQTRVAQGLPYYMRFIERFPTIDMLAQAPLDDVLKKWQGLGYYSRARNMHHTACEIMNSGGNFPKTYNEIIKLKGIGPYTAAAIASFCFKEAVAVVDGNVIRLLCRFYGIMDAPDRPETLKTIKSFAQELISKQSPDEYNQAIMEFGATICTPANPLCQVCIFKNNCKALELNLTDQIPAPKNATIKRNRFFYYFVLKQGPYTYIKQRIGKDIWQSLYEFPLIELSEKLSDKQFLLGRFAKKLLKGIEYRYINKTVSYTHKLSHQTIYAIFYEVEIKGTSNNTIFSDYKKIHFYELENYPISRLTEQYLETQSLRNKS